MKTIEAAGGNLVNGSDAPVGSRDPMPFVSLQQAVFRSDGEILNTFAHTMGAAGVGSQALQVFGAEWETLIAVLLTLAILYLSEIIPKTLGALYWRDWSPAAARALACKSARSQRRNRYANLAANGAILVAGSFNLLSPTLAALMSNALTLGMIRGALKIKEDT